MLDSLPDIASEYEALVQFLYVAPVGLVQIASDGEILMINPVSAQLLMPLTRDASLVNLFSILESVLPDLRHTTALFEPSHGIICDGVTIRIGAGGRGNKEPQFLSLTLLKLDETRLMAVLSDITQQLKRERLLRQSEVWLNAVLTGISDYALIGLDANGCIVDWNASIGRVTGFEADATIGRDFSIFYPEDAITPDRVRDRLSEADENGWSLDDGWRMKANGSRFWGSGMIATLPVRVEGAQPEIGPTSDRTAAYCLIIRDITDKREVTERQRIETSCDHLTGVANRRAFYDAAELEMDRWRRIPRLLSIIMFDADEFKAINDRYGHPAGDAVLRDFGAVLARMFRPVDTAARVGGEEFAVLMPSTGLDGAVAAANRLREAVAARIVHVDGHQIRYTVSGGVATMDAGLAGVDALVKRADLSLYAAKAAGRNRVEAGAGVPGLVP